MKRFMRSIVTVALVFLVVAISQSVAAGRPQAVSIEGVATQGSFDEGPPATGTNFGTWTASGSFSDSGTYVENFQLFFRPDGQIAYVVATLLMTGSAGSFEIGLRMDGFPFVSPASIEFEGRWWVVGGTAAYFGITGQGTLTLVVDLDAAVAGDPSNFATLVGHIRL